LPMFFGPRGELFGCYHAPTAGSGPTMGAVLCYPFGHEYIRAHRSFLQLAKGLAGKGVPALRFDYFGCGDSAGASDGGRVERWVADIRTAVEELRTRSGVERVCLIGLRLGAALAAVAATDQRQVSALALWDPVISGSVHRDEMRTAQLDLLRFGNIASRTRDISATPTEVLGFPLPPALAAGIADLDLLKLDMEGVEKVLVVESGRAVGIEALCSSLSTRSRLEHRHVPDPSIWAAEPHQTMVPHRLLSTVVSWVAGADR
jgi:uncharacterized protein